MTRPRPTSTIRLPRWRVYYNTHRYVDCSDTARACSRIVRAATADEAREIVRNMERVGSRQPRWIGMVHNAEPLQRAKEDGNEEV